MGVHPGNGAHEGAVTNPRRSAPSLDLRGGDVWAWSKRLTGACPPDASIELRLDGESIPAERDGERFPALVRLRPGPNRVTAVSTAPDGATRESAPVVHTVRLAPRPTARVAATTHGDAVVLDGSRSEPSAYEGAPIEGWSWAFRPDNPAPLVTIEHAAECVVVQKPAAAGEYVVSLTVADAAGRTDTGSARFTVAGGSVRVPDPMTDQALWIERATVYGVVPGTFGEPGFAAVTARLDDLRDLGIAALWLSPITRTLPGDFGYAVTDYFDTRQDYGTKEDFRGLVQAAHARGIRVLIDVVPNHTSMRHPYFADLETHGSASPYVDFYDRDERGETTYYFHYTQLRNLDFDNPEVRAFVIEALAFWVREYDVDGFRVDVAWGIRDRRPDFWAACNAELKRLKPDALLIAEASARDPFYVANGFDAAYDWTDKLGRWAWSDFLEDGAPMAEGVTAAVRHTGADGEEHPLVFRFLNNNDTGPRFITTHGVDCYRVASAMLLTLPGLPCVYNGDEVGAEFLPYEDDTVDWTDRHGLRAHFRHLITLRAEVPSLHSRRWRPLPVEPARPLFGYLRFGSPADQPCLVLLNFSGDDLEATLPMPADFAALERPGELFDLYARQPVRITTDGAHRTIPMPPWAIRILVADVGGVPASVARPP